MAMIVVFDTVDQGELGVDVYATFDGRRVPIGSMGWNPAVRFNGADGWIGVTRDSRVTPVYASPDAVFGTLLILAHPELAEEL